MGDKMRQSLILRNLEQRADNNRLLNIISKRSLVVLWHTQFTEVPTLSYFIPVFKISDFLNADCEVIILFSEYHTNSHGLDLPEQILDLRQTYHEEVIKAILASIGAPITKLKFIREARHLFRRKFATNIREISSKFQLNGNNKLSLPEMTRIGLQALDEEFYHVDAKLGNADERESFILADEFLNELGFANRIHLMYPNVPALARGKMSSSVKDTTIQILENSDTVKQKLEKIFCEYENVSKNGVLRLANHLVFHPIEVDEENEFIVKRDGNGDIKFRSYDELQKSLSNQQLQLADLTTAIALHINKLLDRVRTTFQRVDLQKIVDTAYSDIVEDMEGPTSMNNYLFVWDYENEYGSLRKPTQTSPITLQFEIVPSDNENSLMSHYSKFGKIQHWWKFDYSQKSYVTVVFDTPEATMKAVQYFVDKEHANILAKDVKHLSFDRWYTFLDPQTTLLNRLKSNGFKRRILYTMFIQTTDAAGLSKQILCDIQGFSKECCMRIPSHPIVDFIDILCTGQHIKTSVAIHTEVTCETTIKRCIRKIPMVLHIKPSIFEPGMVSEKQPVILTTDVKLDETVESHIFEFSKQVEANESDGEANESDASSDDNESVDFVSIKNLRYKMLALGEPWTTYVRRVSSNNVLPKERSANKEIMPSPPKKRKIMESSRNSESSGDSVDSASSSSSKAWELAQKSFCNFASENMTRITSDKLHIDVLIVCADVKLCRYLSAIFGIVHLDEIILRFQNTKCGQKDRITFESENIVGTISGLWDNVTNKQSHHKTYRLLQTRFSEYLTMGFHNIALTCCETVVRNTTANFYGYIGSRTQVEELNSNLFTYAVALHEENCFISGVKAVTELVNHALGHRAVVPMLLRFQKQYYRVYVSAICVIPFYVLRSIAARKTDAATDNFLVEHYDNPKDLYQFC